MSIYECISVKKSSKPPIGSIKCSFRYALDVFFICTRLLVFWLGLIQMLLSCQVYLLNWMIMPWSVLRFTRESLKRVPWVRLYHQNVTGWNMIAIMWIKYAFALAKTAKNFHRYKTKSLSLFWCCITIPPANCYMHWNYTCRHLFDHVIFSREPSLYFLKHFSYISMVICS